MWLYNIVIILYSAAVRIASAWLPKAKLWHEGRKDIFKRMADAISPNDRILWVHVASLGEFEQGRPLIERIKEQHPEYKILLTFFSPSGYELRKDYKGADYIFYLPADTPRAARRFLDVTHPEVAIFVKYEFWLNTLFELRRRNIKTFIVSAIFRENAIFFRWYGSLWRLALKSFDKIFVQDEKSKLRLEKIGFNNAIIAGDTRFDRVAQIAQGAKRNTIIEEFMGSTPLFIAGSTWPADETLLEELIKENQGIKFVIAPHEIGNERVEELQGKLKGSIRYTQIDSQSNVKDNQILILDTMGQLSSIYSYASWAYIGGGFGVGIHNTLEASTFGLPMAFGPNYLKFKEAVDMIELGACRSITTAQELKEWFAPLRDDKEHLQRVSQITKQYTLGHRGATKVIIDSIFE